MSAEFKGYRLHDFVKATIAAPLASIPVTILVVLVAFYPDFRIGSNYGEELGRWVGGVLFYISLSLPSAYISTALFGGIGLAYANSAQYRIRTPAGTVAGIVCGAIAGIGWIVYVTGENFELQLLFSGPVWGFIFPISIWSGFLAGLVYMKLIE